MKILISLNSSWNLYNFRIDLIKKLIYLNHEIYITIPKDEYFQKIINLKLKIKVNQLNIDRKSFNIFKNLYLLFQYLKIYNKIKPDLVLLYTIKPNIIGSIASFFSFKKIKIYNFITGLGTFIFENNLKKKMILSLYKLAFLNSNTTILQNIDDYNYFVNNKIIKASRCKIIPGSGVDTNFYKYNIKNKTNDSFNFLCVSRLIKQKGILELVQAAKIVKKNYPNVNFTIIGSIDYGNLSSIDVSEYELLKKYIKHKKFSESIINELINCDCFILPSYREGTSMSLLEAASIGRPIITTDVPGCNNIVSEGLNGYLCKSKDVKSLCDCIIKMLNTNLQDRLKMGHNSRKVVENKFDKEIINELIINEITRK